GRRQLRRAGAREEITVSYDPEHYLEAATRSIKQYVESNVNTRIYQVVMEFPAAAFESMKMPMRKTILHFELDAQDDNFVGFGDRPMGENYDEASQSVTPQWAGVHNLNFDVGIW